MTISSLGPESGIRRLNDGSVDCEFYRQKALREREVYLSDMLSDASPGLAAPLPPTVIRGVKVFAAAFALATAAFWAVMLTSPPVTEAGPVISVPVQEFMRDAPRDLPVPEADRF